MTKDIGADTSNKTRLRLHEVKPRELIGRDVIARFQSQFRAAALESLRILQGSGVDRVYCDYQDDVVTCSSADGLPRYHFFQVKTKGSKKYQWSRLELFGLPKRLPASSLKNSHLPGGASPAPPTAEQLAKIRSSFIGRLLEHTVNFAGSCASITFLTNVFLEDEVEIIAAAISAGNVGERTVRYLADNYPALFGLAVPLEMREVHDCLRKLSLSPGHDYLDPDHTKFEAKAIEAVWEYSEIDLAYTEGVELVESLLALVQKKSSATLISELTEGELDRIAGIGLEDLLAILPISRGAYRTFLTQGDASALKNASILQRKLSKAGASESIIETASRWKVDWDNWYRTYRHSYEGDIMFLQHALNEIYGRWSRGEVSFGGLKGEALKLMSDLGKGPLRDILTAEMLIGGILAELVRSESR